MDHFRKVTLLRPLLISSICLLTACGGGSGGEAQKANAPQPEQSEPSTPDSNPEPEPAPTPAPEPIPEPEPVPVPVPAPEPVNNDVDNDGIVNADDIDDDNDGLIEISSIEMLNNMRHDLSGRSYHNGTSASTQGCPNNETLKSCTGYELTQNLDFNTSLFGKEKGDKLGWLPVGNFLTPFTAIFDGNNFSLNNLYIEQNQEMMGFFGAMRDAVVKNLTIQAEVIAGSETKYVGALSGFIRSPNQSSSRTGLIKNINISGSVVASRSRSTGGLIGEQQSGYYQLEYCNPFPCDDTIYNIASSHIVDVQSSVSVMTESGLVGGLIGKKLGGNLVSSSSTGDVRSTRGTVGGLVGEMGTGPEQQKNRIVSSFAANTVVTQQGSVAGGLVGYQKLGSEILASYSANTSVNADEKAAGFVGQWSSQSGLASQIPRIRHSYTRSQNVSGGSFVFGFSAGLFNNRGIAPAVENSYWDRNKTGDGTVRSSSGNVLVVRSSHGTGYSSDQLTGSGVVNNENPGYLPGTLYKNNLTFDAPYHHWLPSDWTATTNDEKLRVYCDNNGDGIIQDNENTAIWNMGNNQQYPIINCIDTSIQSRD